MQEFFRFIRIRNFVGNGRKCGRWGEEGVGMEEGIRLVLQGYKNLEQLMEFLEL